MSSIHSEYLRQYTKQQTLFYSIDIKSLTYFQSDDTRYCDNTICPPEDGHVNARNMSRIELFHQPTLMHNFLYSLTICLLHYYPLTTCLLHKLCIKVG